MELREAIYERRSVRGFKEEPVSKEILEDVLKTATRAISASNMQPWEFAVVTGELLEKIGKEIEAGYLNGEPEDYEEDNVGGVYKQRKVGVAKQLFGAMDIAREDKENRQWWTRRGFRFFDAPAAIIIYADKELDKAASNFDLGCVTQNICLAAMEHGLGTCAEIQGIMYQKPLRKYLAIPESKRFAIAVAIGYADDSFPANHVVSTREEINEITRWYGFDE